MLLSEVGRLNNIQVTDEEVRRAILQEAMRYPGQEQQFMEFYQENAEAQASIRAPIFEDKIVDFILEMATVTDKAASAEELFEVDEADADAADSDTEKKKPAKKAKAKAKSKDAAEDKAEKAEKPKAKAKKPAAKKKDEGDAG